MKLKPGTLWNCPVCCNEYSTDDNPELCLNIATHRSDLIAENKRLKAALEPFTKLAIRLGEVMTSVNPADVRVARKILGIKHEP